MGLERSRATSCSIAPRSWSHSAWVLSARGGRQPGLEGDAQVSRGHGGKKLGNVLLGIGIVLAAKLGVDGRGLVGAHTVQPRKAMCSSA